MIRLIDLFRYYQKLGHQTAAINELEQAILSLIHISEPTRPY